MSLIQVDLKQRLYNIVLKAMMTFSVLSIIGNLILRLPPSVNIKWIFLFSSAFFSFLYDRYRSFNNTMRFIFFLFLTGIVMPLCFIDAGGSRSDTMAYMFFALIVVTYIFDGHYRNILIATIVVSFIGMHTYEYFFPEKIPVYNTDSRFIDRIIQVPIVLFLTFLVVRLFADAYSQTNKHLVQYAHYDELTGLLSRRNFNDILQKHFDSGDQDGYLIMMDIDNFKLINDEKGHLAGDDSLKYLGRILSRYFDDGNNMISRWGGDEFIIIYLGDVIQLNAILKNVKRDFKEYIDSIEPRVDISVGIAPLKGCQTPNDVLALSDQLMYQEKWVKKN
jgi:diguanylate cyclase (GGDEF)-like protein